MKVGIGDKILLIVEESHEVSDYLRGTYLTVTEVGPVAGSLQTRLPNGKTFRVCPNLGDKYIIIESIAEILGNLGD